MTVVFGAADRDDVFRALADPFRRDLLDRLHAEPGLNVGELTQRTGRSRYAVMRHLRALEDAFLVSSRKVGRERCLYVNGAPLQAIYDRWMSRHAGVLAEFVGSVKGRLAADEAGETRPRDLAEPVGHLRHRFTEYIRTSPDRLWQALTKSEVTRLYFHGLEVQSTWELGASIRYLRSEEGGGKRVEVDGIIFEIEPGRRLGHTFRFPDRPEPVTRALYRIDPLGAAIRLTVDHEGFESSSETYRITREGWPPILSSLKSYLESGEPLVLPQGY